MHPQSIKKLITIFFLLVFSLGNMPRQFFHETLASHRDTISSCNHAQKAMGCIHQVNFNCHYDNLVVNTIYEADHLYSPSASNILATEYYSLFLISRNSTHPGNKENKGPPVVA